MSLKEAYCQTRFMVFESPIVIEVGKNCPALDEQLLQHGAQEWAYITAWNPRSKLLSEAENHRRHQGLTSELSQYVCWEGEGVGTDKSWKPERSWLILGIPREHAIEIGKRWEQNAIVYGRLNGPAELLQLFDYE
jgi:hypothetical protein